MSSSLILLCALLVGGSYGAWCAERLPRTRLLLALAGAVCLAGAVWLHGEFFSAPATPVSASAGPATFGR